MKLTKKQFAGLTAARQDMCFNDAYIQELYGVTLEQVSAFTRVCDVLVGADWRLLTLADVNAALDGKKVALARLDESTLARIERAFSKR